MAKIYQCPKCNGTEIVWDRALRKSVCPKDRTPVDNYKALNQEEAEQAP